jgi:hypothetical protein
MSLVLSFRFEVNVHTSPVGGAAEIVFGVVEVDPPDSS